MTTDNTLSVRVALQSGAGAAENQLAVIAGTAGDNQLAEVVAEFKPAEIAVMVSDADMSKPSLAHAFISPEQFIAAFCRLGARWGEVQPSPTMDFVSFQRDVEDFICPMILASEDPTRRAAMLSALLDHELGVDVLFFLSLNHKESLALLERPYGYPFAVATHQEVLALTYEHHPTKFQEIAAMAIDVYGSGEEAVHEFAFSVLSSLHDEAARHMTPEETVEEEFVDI